MNIAEVVQTLQKSENYKELEKWLTGTSKALKIGGTQGSAPALFVHTAQKAAQLPAVYILHDAEEAGYFYGDLCQLSEQNVYYFPSSYKKKIKDGLTKDAPNQVLRTEALSALQGDAPVTLVTYPEALTELVIAPALLSKETLQLKVGNTLSTDYVIELLLEYGFTQTDFVYEPGQFSVRGSLIDVFSFSNDVPYRIDFFGDDIDSIRTFDIESQLSIESLNEIAIVSSTVNTTEENLVPIFQFFKECTLMGLFDAAYCLDVMTNIANENTESSQFINPQDVATCFSSFRCIEWGLRNHFAARKQVHFNQAVQPIFHKNFDLVSTDFAQHMALGYQVFVWSDNPKQIDRLKDIFEDRPEKISFTPVINIVHEGFIDHDLKICIYTDHQIFERYHKYSLKSTKTRAGKVVMSLKELMQIQVGDYIVHQDHGVGRFGGLI
ncbi:MAG: transcription-repair coupling factor, partial [Paludibacteraceae bacterium]|nr:transcription-repair coupling factor [Paludibacteraceae bacterium]